MTKRVRALAAALAGAAVLAGCTDLSNPGGGGVIIPTQMQVIVQDEGSRAVLGRVLPSGEVQGSITVAEGGQRKLIVSLLDDGGQPVAGPTDEIRVSVVNTVVATFQLSGRTTVAAYGTLVGNSAGATSLRVQLVSGPSTRYESPSIPVTVR